MNKKFARIALLTVLGFLLMFSYSLSRPAVESLFLESHSSKSLPNVWLLLSLAIIIVTHLYNKYVLKVELLMLCARISIISAFMLTFFLIFRILGVPYVDYALYIWKEIYIIILFGIFYSFSNSVLSIKESRWAFCIFGISCSISGIIGNLAIGFLAKTYGSEASLWFVLPLLFSIFLLCFFSSRNLGIEREICKPTNSSHGVGDVIDVIRSSQYLWLILWLMIILEIVGALIDYEYSRILQNNYVDLDQRTVMTGQIYAIASVATLILHILKWPIIRIAGIPLTFTMIPLMMGFSIGIYAVVPTFIAVAALKITGKSLDYTLLRTTREMLYIPLDYRERTVGKSVVDTMVQRLAKGVASFLILGIAAANFHWTIPWIIGLLLVIWFIFARLISIRFRSRVSRECELA